MNYDKFKNEIWPFYWEKREIPKSKVAMTEKDWEALLSMTPKTEAVINDGNF